MRAFRDMVAPLAAHDIVFDRVPLSFGENGLLLDPDADQLAVMSSTPMRAARFVEVDPPKAPEPPPAPKAEPTSAPATAKSGKKAAATPIDAPDEGSAGT